ncbi:N-acetylmuramoyl-L-alanine amidase [Ruminiclostridium herbifermentans]|uniref:N-acetylmuramoyl-L-alanine amidase n=2 Tax=Ruminiclostridium herbifermentans TaxID=2488810 RepID=A0A4U7JPF9_9FIRM|nr:N-acetylmuramoyl-L-alanine amidase [Ruminiclostridium herbifermentans]
MENGRYSIIIPERSGVFIKQEVLNIDDSLVSSVEIKEDEETKATHIVFNIKTEVNFYISYNEKSNVTEINLLAPKKAELSYINKYDRVYFSLKGIQLASVGSTITNYFTESYDAEQYTIILPASSKIFLKEEVFNIDDSRVSTVEIKRDKETRDTHIVINTKKEFKFFISFNEKLNQSEINLLTPAKDDEIIVVIDAGHGGVDPGACKGTTYEKDLNLAIALKLEELLEAKNIKTYMIRQDDTFVGLYDRPYIANALNATLFLSIHNNSIDNSKVSGTETLYYPERAGDTSFTGEKFAKLLQDSLINKLKTVNRKTVERPNLVVLKYTKMPAALCEIGFLTNPTDLKNLKSEAFQQKTAQALCDAVIKALEKIELEKKANQ